MKILSRPGIVVPVIFMICTQGCKKPCVESSHQFAMTEVFSPEADSIRLGDTLWVVSSHSTSFTDSAAGQVIDFSNSVIGINTRILEFPVNSTTVEGATGSFGYIKIHGSETGNDNIPAENKGFWYDKVSGQYLLKLGFVTLQKGVFSISLSNSIGVVEGKSGCTKADFEIDNNNADNHLYFYQDWRPGYTISSYEASHMYCFRVY